MQGRETLYKVEKEMYEIRQAWSCIYTHESFPSEDYLLNLSRQFTSAEAHGEALHERFLKLAGIREGTVGDNDIIKAEASLKKGGE